MHIHVNDSNKNFRLTLPTGLVLNRFTALFIPRFLKNKGIKINRAKAVAFVKCLNRYRRSHKDWVLVEAESADGSFVKIKL